MPRVNLVPQEEQAREFRRRIYIFPIAGAILLVGALGGSYYYYTNQQTNAKNELDQTQQSIDAKAPQLAELQRYEDAKSQKQARLSSVNNLYNARVRWSRILDDISFVIPEDIWLNSITAEVPGAQASTAAAGKPAATDTSQQDIVIEGFTYENSMPTIATFMVRLALLPALSEVTLESAATEKVGNDLVIRFKIGAKLKQGPEAQRPVSAPNTGEQGPSSVTPTTGTGTSTTGTGTGTTGTSRTTTGSSTSGSSGGVVRP
jgi:Tfp pilus assembly protein PilN